MKNILIVSGHTDLSQSIANKTILEELNRLLPDAEMDYLDKLYPDYQIDIISEQKKMEKADIIVLQFPIFWYSMPSILERWMEETFVHGWSHGTHGDKLKGKKLIVSFTTGAPEEMYHQDGLMGYAIDEYLTAIKSTCQLCQMDYVGRVYTGNVSYQTRTDLVALDDMKKRSVKHATKVVDLIQSLS